MSRDKTKNELERLIAEAPMIAPSIVHYEEKRNYGAVTDEQIDAQAAQRWNLEAASVLQQLSISGSTVFNDLQAQYLKTKAEATSFHSRSIFVHQTMQILITAVQLMGSEQSKIKQGQIVRELELPDKVTIPWLLKHVPITFWMAAGGLLISAFFVGIKASEISLVQEIFILPKAVNTQCLAAPYVPIKP